MKLRLLLLAVVLFAGGCASTTRPSQAVDTPKGAAEKRIRVTADSQRERTLFAGLDKRLYITHVDDESTNTACFHWPDCYAEEVLVAPGRHYLKLKFAHLGSFARTTVWFDAEEGKSYIVRKRLSGYGVQFWVEDASTGRPVGGLPGAEEETKK